MAGLDWEDRMIDETGQVFDCFSLNGINVWIKKYWVYIDNVEDYLNPIRPGELCFSMRSGNLFVNKIRINAGQPGKWEGVFLFIRFLNRERGEYEHRFGIGCYGYDENGKFVGITPRIIRQYKDWLLQTVGDLPIKVNFDAMLTKKIEGN